MWPFKRRQPDDARPEAAWDGRWVVARGEHQGRPMIVRKNVEAAGLAGNAEFSVRLGIAVPFRSPDANGMPSEPEFDVLAEIEDTLIAQLHVDRKAIAVLTITTAGMREFVFYTRDPNWAQAVVEDVRKTITTHELQGYVAPDEQWEVYAEFRL